MLRRGLPALAGLLLLAASGAWAEQKPVATAQTPFVSTADHKSFAALQKDFASGPEVTKACLGCHTNAAKQMQKTEHWTWSYENKATGQTLGKRKVINNFCTSIQTNQDHCTECHTGYNMKDENFDFSNEENVDCLVCHDTTGRYKKDPDRFGIPLKSVDLKAVALAVGKTSRATCGECHFNGGGGDGSKHGDLDSSLDHPEKALDVHMDAKGLNFTCATCHQTTAHQVAGSRYAPTAMATGQARMRGKPDARNAATCQDCHGEVPHKTRTLNDHTRKIACQTCHIPTFARGGNPTKTSWDWSTAGKRNDKGAGFQELNDDGYETYSSSKGTTTWAENVVPEYIWFNGTVRMQVIGQKVLPTEKPVRINQFEGSATDGKSRIWPVKVFRGKQAYDPVNQTLIVMHLSGKDDTGFWKNLDWQKGAKVGMDAVGLPFSGKVEFVETEMLYAITHMVAPKDKALTCKECHAANGRLSKVPGVSIPVIKENGGGTK